MALGRKVAIGLVGEKIVTAFGSDHEAAGCNGLIKLHVIGVWRRAGKWMLFFRCLPHEYLSNRRRSRHQVSEYPSLLVKRLQTRGFLSAEEFHHGVVRRDGSGGRRCIRGFLLAQQAISLHGIELRLKLLLLLIHYAIFFFELCFQPRS